MNAKEIATILKKLKVEKGGAGSSQKLCADYSIGFYENPSSDQPYSLALRKGSATQRIGLRRDQVVTKSRSAWKRDCVWRLDQNTIDRISEQLSRIVKCAKDKP